MKVLIWDMFELHNTGGPSGYLYNIHEYLKYHPCPNIVFLSDIINKSTSTNDGTSVLVSKQNNNHSKKSNLLQIIWQTFLKTLKFAPNIKSNITKSFDYIYRIYNIKWSGDMANLDLSDYDFIHFHFLIHSKQFRNTYPNYKGKTIVTSHSPCPWTYETIDMDPSIRYLKNVIIRKECKLYKTSDYLMFPCHQAKEPYLHNKKIRHTLDLMSNRTFYVPTSIISDKQDVTQSIDRKGFGIPENAFIIAFFGRHNNIKGYDILKDIALETLDKNPDIYFLLAGTGDIAPLKHPRWIELGFVSNVKELMKLCDLYIVPNRETYFDLVVIEALRSGLLLSLSKTGGNKYFENIPKNETKGLFFFDIERHETVIGQIHQLMDIKKKQPSIYEDLKKSNISLFLNHFTMEQYVVNYLKEIQQL